MENELIATPECGKCADLEARIVKLEELVAINLADVLEELGEKITDHALRLDDLESAKGGFGIEDYGND